MEPEILSAVLVRLAGQSPLLLAYLVGIALAAAKSGRYPQPALYAGLACGLSLVLAVAGTVFQLWIITWQVHRAMPVAQVGMILSVVGIILNVLHAVAVGLFLAAAFQGRRSLTVN